MTLAAGHIERLASSSRTLADGEVLVREGDEADHVYFIISGELEATNSTAQGEIVVGAIEAGQIIGEVTVIAGGRRTATLRAKGPAEVLVIERADFEQMVNGYDAAIRFVDHHVQQVLDEFDRQGLLDETAVIITADHGDAFGEHGIYSDHVCADECIHHIPLIVRWPGVAGTAADVSPCVRQAPSTKTLPVSIIWPAISS